MIVHDYAIHVGGRLVAVVKAKRLDSARKSYARQTGTPIATVYPIRLTPAEADYSRKCLNQF